MNGAVALNGDGNVVFTPAADFNGAATFDYTVSDGNGGTATQTVSVDVTAVNDAPVVNSMAAVLAEGTSVTVTASDLLASAMDVEGDSLSVSNVQVLGADASVTSDGNGAWTVTPVSGFTGSVSVTYDVNDGTAATSGNLDVTVMMSGGSAGGGSEFQVNTFTQYSQARPSVTALSDGGFLVVWDTYDPDGGDYEVFGQRYDASGAPAGSEFQVNSYTQSDQRFASVAALPDDGFVVTWESYGQDGSSTGILGQRYDISGAPTGSEFQVNSYTTANQVNPSVTAMSDGGFVMTWASWFQDGDGYGIFGQRYDVSGTPLGSDFQVNTYTQSSQVKSSVAAMSDGGFVVTWESYGQDGDTHGIFGQRYDTSGAPVGSEFQINSYTASSQTSSSVAGLSNGGFVVAWESYDQDGDGYEILGQRYDTSGASVGSEFQVNSFTQDDQRYPSVAAMPDGGFLVTWGSNNQDGGDWGIFGQRYGASGSPLGSEFQINSHTGNAQNHSSVAALPDGGFVVTWQSEGSQDGSESGIFAKIFEASSELAGTDGNDILVGGNEDDILTGGDGNDRLEGGAGDDVINGGGGTDVAMFSGNTDGYSFGVSGSSITVIDNVGANGSDILTGVEELHFADMTFAVIGTTVSAINDTPVTGGDSAVTVEDTKVTILASDLLSNDTDADGDTLSLTSVSNPMHGSVLLDGNGDVVFTPDADFNGVGSFDYLVSDGNRGEATQTVTVTVSPEDDAPVVSAPATGSLAEDSALVVTTAELLANATDVDGDTLSVSNLAVTGTDASVTDNGDGTWTVSPVGEFNGAVRLSYDVSDGTSTVAGSLDLTIAAVNDAPAAISDSASTSEDTAVTVLASTLLANDSDIDGDTLSISGVSNAVNGAVALNGDGNVVFTPAADFNGAATFDYTVSDGNGGTATQTVSVDVTAVNDAPNVDMTSPVSLSLAEDGTLLITQADFLSNASDIEGDTLSVSGVAVDSGTITDDGDGTWAFAPGADFNGSVTLSYNVSDGTNSVADAGTITVTAVNDAPNVDMTSPVSLSLAEDGTLLITQADFLSNATDVDGDTLSVSGVTVDSGTVTDNGDGTWAFAPGADFNGSVTLSYNVSDGTNSVADAGTITVTAVNDAPDTLTDSAGTNEDSAVTILTSALLNNDSDVEGDTLTLTGVFNALGGSVNLDGNGDVVFTPTADFNGSASFDYTVSDGNGGTATQTVTVDVTAVNDAPNTAGNSASISEDTAVTVLASTLLANDSDIDGDTLSISGVSNAVNGAVALDGNGDVVFTPAADFNGAATFDYTVSDGNGGTATQTVSVDVTAVNDAPSVDMTSPVSLSLAEDGNLLITQAEFLSNASDIEGDTLSVSGVTVDSGTITDNGDGTWAFAPGADFNGSVTLSYNVSDGTNSVADAGTITVTAVNDAPVVSAPATGSLAEDSALVVTTAELLANATDVDGDTLSVSNLAVTGTDASVTDNGDGTWTISPVGEFNGAVRLSYDVSDGTSTVAGSLDLTIAAVNDAPAAISDSASTSEDTAVTVLASTLLANDSDIDGDTLSISGVSNAVNGAVALNGDGNVVFTPAADFNGAATFDYTVSDGNGGTATQTVSVDVTAVNDAPNVDMTSPVSLSLAEDGTLLITQADFLSNASDIEGDTLSVSGVGR